MSYDFFADEFDKIEVLKYIFNDTNLEIYDHYSIFGEKVCRYENVEAITSKFDLKNGEKFSNNFQLWSPDFKGSIVFEKIKLDPKQCKGHTFRFATRGWGLMQLYFGGIKGNNISLSHIGHFNEKGALKWEGIKKINGKVSAWDWKEISKTSLKLKYHIDKKLAITRIGARGILPNADNLIKQGVNVIYG
jgi:hypothetical protein